MAFFDYNDANEHARRHLYVEFARHSVWKPQNRRWSPRQRCEAYGRLYTCFRIHGERFYLRTLLMSVRGPRSFADLRTVHGTLNSTFRAACVALGLLADDQEWFRTFDEAVETEHGRALRNLLSLAIIFGLADPLALWERYRMSICDDLPHFLQRRGVRFDADEHLDYGLSLLKDTLEREYNIPYSNYNLPEPIRNWNLNNEDDRENPDDVEPLNIDIGVNDLNNDQRRCFDIVLNAIHNDPHKAHFFLQGPGGTGKTFLYKCLFKHVLDQG